MVFFYAVGKIVLRIAGTPKKPSPQAREAAKPPFLYMVAINSYKCYKLFVYSIKIIKNLLTIIDIHNTMNLYNIINIYKHILILRKKGFKR